MTESPYKIELEASQATISSKSKQTVKKTIFVKAKNIKSTEISKRGQEKINNSAVSASEDDTKCIVCAKTYSETEEDWYNCHGCSEWAHESCGVMDDLYFICANCIN